jgi:hypothetical protein
MSHPPNPPVNYVPPPRERKYRWRPLWLRLLLPLRIKSLAKVDATRRKRYEDETRLVTDDEVDSRFRRHSCAGQKTVPRPQDERSCAEATQVPIVGCGVAG